MHTDMVATSSGALLCIYLELCPLVAVSIVLLSPTIMKVNAGTNFQSLYQLTIQAAMSLCLASTTLGYV